MNIQRLEMMRVMLLRIAAGSWEPTPVLVGDELKWGGYTPDALVDIKKFDLGYWVLNDGTTKTENGNVCGFSACAVGHACFDEEFRKLGWKWIGSTPTYSGEVAWDAVLKFFEISDGTDELMFMDDAYPYDEREDDAYPYDEREYDVTPKMVADRIQELMTLGELKFREKYKSIMEML